MPCVGARCVTVLIVLLIIGGCSGQKHKQLSQTIASFMEDNAATIFKLAHPASMELLTAGADVLLVQRDGRDVYQVSLHMTYRGWAKTHRMTCYARFGTDDSEPYEFAWGPDTNSFPPVASTIQVLTGLQTAWEYYAR
jgi:hypothetical protein